MPKNKDSFMQISISGIFYGGNVLLVHTLFNAASHVIAKVSTSVEMGLLRCEQMCSVIYFYIKHLGILNLL